MTTEIDLTLVKALIDRAFALKEEKEQLLKQLNHLQTTCVDLKSQISVKESEKQSQHDELSNQLKKQQEQHQSKLVELAESHRLALESQANTAKVKLDELNEQHAKAFSGLESELSQKNAVLSDALAYSQQQNKALVTRIQGVEL